MTRGAGNLELSADLQEHGLELGTFGSVMFVHYESEAYEVEFVPLDRETVAVVSLCSSQVRPFAESEVGHAACLPNPKPG